MKKIFGILAVGILLQFTICTGNSFSYTIDWSDLSYYAGAQVGVSGVEVNNTLDVQAYDKDSGTDDYAAAIVSSPHHLETEAYATSYGLGAAKSLSLFYGKITVTDTPGTQIPLYVNGNLTGSLNGSSTGTATFKSGVGGAIMLYNDTGHPSIETIIGTVKGDTDLPTPIWSWYDNDSFGQGFDFSFPPGESEPVLNDINFSHSSLFSFTSGQSYYLLAGFGADAYAYPGLSGSANAHSDFYNSFDFSITQAAVPEPASLSLLGLGLLGLFGIGKRKENR